MRAYTIETGVHIMSTVECRSQVYAQFYLSHCICSPIPAESSMAAEERYQLEVAEAVCVSVWFSAFRVVLQNARVERL